MPHRCISPPESPVKLELFTKTFVLFYQGGEEDCENRGGWGVPGRRGRAQGSRMAGALQREGAHCLSIYSVSGTLHRSSLNSHKNIVTLNWQVKKPSLGEAMG